ncbi:hypothetical protein AMIS_2730 [Actinoplanes missouriensis 431]|uniref:Uncharacterized protein n=1 Tax=Actinoplanes missouriensis (strain ATCC 14538 / DSM 43046 / CBS 188.64 / JCM 3121 / NBRC 102363 / NCIMB 12654 / NRRL B-3342 / UNCC 431) TaxID=512565 RepID=I0GXK6_ACTM4|nr:hypothetical protein [Actinoplanes missouriensis]KOX45240.1 hypothetical protein ADL19_23220 [Streptomyces purpurogeneiscleroticus]BAL85493.1 hypothetical protein AMIS_2730 [Actinoplanes missouriensis 431]
MLAFPTFGSTNSAIFAGILAAIGFVPLAALLVLGGLGLFSEPVIAPGPVLNPVDLGEAPETTQEIPAVAGEPEVQPSGQATGRYQPRHAAEVTHG